MIDLHCHILPGLDDGALGLDDALAMARQAEQDGIEVVCATPHVREDHDVRPEQLAECAHSLQDQLDARAIAVRVLPGAEIAASSVDRLSDAQLRLAALGGEGAWVLLEPAPGPLDGELAALVARLGRRGMRVVLAHPERHAGDAFAEHLHTLAQAGVLIQWTAEFLAQAVPGDLVMGLAAEGLVHVLGSDAHSSYGGRPLQLSAGFASLARVRTPEQMAWTIERAPRAIIRDEPLAPSP